MSEKKKPQPRVKRNKGPKEPRVSINLKAVDNLMKNDIASAVTISKLQGANLNDLNTEFDSDNIYGTMAETADSFSANGATCNFLKIFPELKTALLTLVSLTLSPRQSVTSEVNYVQSKKVLPTNSSTVLMRKAVEYLEDTYGIRDSMYGVLTACALGKGAVCKVVIPENSLDHIINGALAYSKENMSPVFTSKGGVKSLNFLGPVSTEERSTFESMMPQLYHEVPRSKTEEAMCIEVVDNYNFLKVPAVAEKVQADQRANKLRSHHIYGETNTDIDEEPLVVVRPYVDNLREAVGPPLVLEVDVTSLLLVSSPTDVSRRLGAFVMLNEKGVPVNRITQKKEKKKEESLMDRINAGVLGDGKQQSDWTDGNKDNTKNKSSALTLYEETGMRLLMSKLTNGLYGGGVTIEDNTQFFQVLLGRSLASKQTKLVFVPGELLSYFYMDLSPTGVGKNMLEDYNDLNSLRAALLYTEIDSAITSNIQHTEVTLGIDEDDPDPRATKDVAVAEILKAKQRIYPNDLSTHGDLVRWLQRAAISVKYSEIPGLPTTNVAYEYKKSGKEVTDFAEVNNKLRNQIITGILGDPSLMDSEGNVQFASVEEDKRMLTAKKVRIIQVLVQKQWTEHIQRLLLNDGKFRLELMADIKNELPDIRKVTNTIHKKRKAKTSRFASEQVEIEHYFDIFVKNLMIELPNPVTTDFSKMMEKLEAYISGLETVLPHYISGDLYSSELDGADLDAMVDTLTANWTAIFVREWLADNGFMTELSRMVTTNNVEGRINLGKEVASHKKGMYSNIRTFVNDSIRDTKAAGKIRKLKDEVEDEVPPPPSPGGDEGNEEEDLVKDTGDEGEVEFDEDDPVAGPKKKPKDEKDEGDEADPVKTEKPVSDKDDKDDDLGDESLEPILK